MSFSDFNRFDPQVQYRPVFQGQSCVGSGISYPSRAPQYPQQPAYQQPMHNQADRVLEPQQPLFPYTAYLQDKTGKDAQRLKRAIEGIDGSIGHYRNSSAVLGNMVLVLEAYSRDGNIGGRVAVGRSHGHGSSEQPDSIVETWRQALSSRYHGGFQQTIAALEQEARDIYASYCSHGNRWRNPFVEKRYYAILELIAAGRQVEGTLKWAQEAGAFSRGREPAEFKPPHRAAQQQPVAVHWQHGNMGQVQPVHSQQPAYHLPAQKQVEPQQPPFPHRAYLQDKAGKDAQRLKKAIKGIDGIIGHYRNSSAVLGNMVIVLEAYSRDGNINGRVAVGRSHGHGSSEQPDSIIETWRQALNPRCHGGFQQTIAALEQEAKDAYASYRTHGNRWRNPSLQKRYYAIVELIAAGRQVEGTLKWAQEAGAFSRGREPAEIKHQHSGAIHCQRGNNTREVQPVQPRAQRFDSSFVRIKNIFSRFFR